MNPNNIDILNIDGADYRCNVNKISKSEALNLLQKADLSGKKTIHYRI